MASGDGLDGRSVSAGRARCCYRGVHHGLQPRGRGGNQGPVQAVLGSHTRLACGRDIWVGQCAKVGHTVATDLNVIRRIVQVRSDPCRHGFAGTLFFDLANRQGERGRGVLTDHGHRRPDLGHDVQDRGLDGPCPHRRAEPVWVDEHLGRCLVPRHQSPVRPEGVRGQGVVDKGLELADAHAKGSTERY